MTRQEIIYQWALACGGEVTTAKCHERFPGMKMKEIHTTFSGLANFGNVTRRKDQRTGRAYFRATDKYPVGKGGINREKIATPPASDCVRFEIAGRMLNIECLPVIRL